MQRQNAILTSLSQYAVRVIRSRQFKVATVVVGVIFLASTLVIAANPRRFLDLGYIGVFLYSLFGVATVLVPLLSNHLNIYLLAVVAAAGNALNDSVTYVIGKAVDDLTKQKHAAIIQKHLEKYGGLFLLVFSLVPFPYDAIGLVAGYLRFHFGKYLAATFLGKMIRYILIGWGVALLF